MASDDSGPRSARRSSERVVLVADDDETTRRLIVKWLASAKLTVLEATSGESALESARAHADDLDAIVLDVMMPGIDGYETLSRLKADPATAAIPIALLTAHANQDGDIVRGVESGAVDHLAKPFSGPVLVAKVKALCERSHGERELRKKLKSAEENATVDPLTGLWNRRHFEARLREEDAHARRHQQPFSLVVIDLDRFKSVNDTYGHAEGDRVLCHVAEAMRSILRKEDAAFRYGGEEFVILLRATDRASAARAAERLQRELKARPIALGDAGVAAVITFSAGVASADAGNGFNARDLVARADAALYRAKRKGRDLVETEASEPS